LSGIGRRTMLLNARSVFYEENYDATILLAIEDIVRSHLGLRIWNFASI